MNVRIVLIAALVAVIGAGALMMCDDSDAAAGDILTEADYGDNCHYTITSNNANNTELTLSITGTEIMVQKYNSYPWYSSTYTPKITTVVIGEGITILPTSAIYLSTGLGNILREVYLPSTLTTIGEYNFFTAQGIQYINYPKNLESTSDYLVSSNSGYIFYNGGEELPRTAEALAGKTFTGSGDRTLRAIPTSGTTGTCTWAIDDEGTLTVSATADGGEMADYESYGPWMYGVKDVVFVGDVTHIGAHAFAGCTGFSDVLAIPATLTSVGAGAFDNCPVRVLTAPVIAYAADTGLNQLHTVRLINSPDLWTAGNAANTPQYSSRATMETMTFANDRIPAFALYGQNLDALTITNVDGADVLGIYTAHDTRATANALTVDGTAASIVRLTEITGSAALTDGRITANNTDVHWNTSPPNYAGGESDTSVDILVYPAAIHERTPNDYGVWMTTISILLIVGLLVALILPMIARRME